MQSLVLSVIYYRNVGIIHRWIFSCENCCGKIFLSLGVSHENFLTMKYFKVKLFVTLLTNLLHNYTYPYTALMCISHKHRHMTTIEYNFEWILYRCFVLRHQFAQGWFLYYSSKIIKGIIFNMHV